jgi:acyl-CoA thioester hydrolase
VTASLNIARPEGAGFIHGLRVRVTPSDTAHAGGIHVHYSVYPRFMDEAVADQLTYLGFARLDMFTRLHGFDGIRRLEIEYLAPAMTGDELLVETWVESARGVRLTRGYEIHNAVSGQLLIRARTEAVWVTESHRPGRWPAEVLVALGVGADS